MTKPTWTWPETSTEWLPHRTIFLTLAGSRAYGTDIPDSDYDVRGLCIPPNRYFHGFVEEFEQAEIGKPHDAVIYEVRKFFRLAAKSNPNILEVLYAEPRHHIKSTFLGGHLLANRDLFLSRRAVKTFSEFARLEMKKLNAVDFDFGEAKACKAGMHLVRLLRMGREILEGHGVQVYRQDRAELLRIRAGAWSFKELSEWSRDALDNLGVSCAHSPLPPEPDLDALDKVCEHLVESALDT